MSDFTIEQLEALKEGTTPGPWEASVQAFVENDGGDYSLHAEVADKDGVPLMYAEDGFVFHREPNFTLAAAAPALVDALIAEKRAHQGLRSYLNDLRGAYGEEFDPNDEWEKGLEYAYREVARELAHILEGE